MAILQRYSPLIYPHPVLSTYGSEIDADLTDRLITQGVDMFLDHCAPTDTRAKRTE